MSTVTTGLSFEVLRFAAAPVSAEVVLLEVEGRFRAEPRRRLGVPRLVVEQAEGSSEVAPAAADEALAEPAGSLWRASYAVALDLLEDGEFSLAVGRELLLGLPVPDLGETDDREVRLAREANALRRTADEARAAAAAALASAGTERAAREQAEAEMAEARMARDDHARRAASLDDELAQLRRDHAAELVHRDEEHQAALAGRDAEAAEAADQRAMVLEAEIAEARRALRSARADIESVQRDLERERERADAAEAALPRGRVTELDGEPVDGEPLDERPTAHIDDEALTDVAEPAPEAPEEEATEVATLDQVEPVEQPPPFAPPEPAETDPGESVRVIGARRPRPSGEGKPAEAAPGTAAIGARHIEPGQTHHGTLDPVVTRVLAFAALAVVLVALLLVLKPF
ncbi:MAG TPA: hypothetical protein VH834_15885 [Solirubrobacteraceae bacterium]